MSNKELPLGAQLELFPDHPMDEKLSNLYKQRDELIQKLHDLEKEQLKTQLELDTVLNKIFET